MAELRCAVAILPTPGGDSARLTASVEGAMAQGLGDLASVSLFAAGADEDSREALASAARLADREAFDWLLAVSDAETLSPAIFDTAAPALRLHDAVWGAAGSISAAGDVIPLERIARLAAHDLPTFFHAALAWWIGPTHFVRPKAALQALHATATSDWYAAYMLELWRNRSVYKTAQALTRFHGPLPRISDADRDRLIQELEANPVFMPVRHGAQTVKLPYTGVNPVIEREQSRGQYFEHEELAFLAERLPRGLRIVDAGANTGNHTVFFATEMEAEVVIPIEPHPRAIAAIRVAVEANRLANVDLSCLGIAVGAAAGRLTAVLSQSAGLGATRFVADPGGAIQLATLDSLLRQPVDFLKIDVEGMEMAVLAGAAATIGRFRPALYIEVLDATIPRFLAWVDGNDYRIEKLFPDKAHCNYLIVASKTS